MLETDTSLHRQPSAEADGQDTLPVINDKVETVKR